MKHPLLAIAAIALMAIPTQAGSKPTLPKEFRGHWCYDAKTEDYRRARCPETDASGNHVEDHLFIKPNGFAAHEVDCKLQVAEPYLHGTNAWRTTFKCTDDPDQPWIAYYWIGTNNGHWTTGSNNGRLYMREETDADVIQRWFTE